MHANERRFVNPYTFVPFPPDGVKRAPAPAHVFDADEADERYAGSFTVRWTTLTELVLPQGQGWYDATTRTVSIPGSSAKGAVRSVHETLFGGCPRVLTSTFTPVYRQALNEGLLNDWKLAVVTESDQGAPKRVRICDEVVWVDAVALQAAYGGQIPTTGDSLHPPAVRKVEKTFGKVGGQRLSRWQWSPKPGDTGPIRRRETNDAMWEQDAYVFLVTDVAARKTTRNQRDPRTRQPLKVGPRRTDPIRQEVAACYWAAGRLGKDEAVFPMFDGKSPAFMDFQRLSEGSRDCQVNEQDDRRALADGKPRAASLFAEVEWWNQPAGTTLRLPGEITTGPVLDIAMTDGRYLPCSAGLWRVAGKRRRADGGLYAGDVIWVQIAPSAGGVGNDDEVTAVKLAAAWRETPTNAGDLGGRVQAKPCRHSAELCLSCCIFGSIDATGEAAGYGQQDAYGGHVRFGAVTATNVQLPAQNRSVRLAPLSSPRPGAALFYLLSRALPGGRPPGDLPAQWGSAIDEAPAGKRLARGRKFYWHSDPTRQVAAVRAAGVPNPQPRYRLEGSGDAFSTVVDLIAPGQDLVQTISFDGLDRLALLTLLAAFDPTRVLDGGDCAIHLGGGKPFGLGSVTATIADAELMVTTVSSRYDGDQHAPASWAWTQSDRQALTTRCGDLTLVHRAAAKVMARDGLGDYEPLVSYPITVPWRNYGTKAFSESFEFFKKNSGRRLNSPEPYVVLPDLNEVADGKTPAIENGGTNV